MTRKYEEIKGYWVYSIKVPSINKYYIGVSKRQCCQRWQKSQYKSSSLNQYLNEWDSMVKTVLIDGLNKEDAYQYEDNIIRALSMNNLCINERRSGLITDDKNAYHRELLKNNTEYHERDKQRSKQWYENNKEDVEFRECRKQQAKQYYEKNKEKISEKRRQRRLKKKLQKQQNSLPLS